MEENYGHLEIRLAELIEKKGLRMILPDWTPLYGVSSVPLWNVKFRICLSLFQQRKSKRNRKN